MIPGNGSNPRMSLQAARIMWLVFLCAAGGIIVLAHMTRRSQPPTAPAPVFSRLIAAVAAVDIVVIGLIRRSLLQKSQEQVQRGDAAAGQINWSKAQALGFASGMSIVLFGFVVGMVGARPEWLSTAFYVAGLLILVAYRPQLEQ
jgi:hypothetical protein